MAAFLTPSSRFSDYVAGAALESNSLSGLLFYVRELSFLACLFFQSAFPLHLFTVHLLIIVMLILYAFVIFPSKLNEW